MTIQEAQAAYDAAVPVPMSRDRIDEMAAFAVRPWKPMSKKRLVAIREALIPETPNDDYTPDEVYRMVSELLTLRRRAKEGGQP